MEIRGFLPRRPQPCTPHPQPSTTKMLECPRPCASRQGGRKSPRSGMTQTAAATVRDIKV
jgi:hypothetical protein